MGYITTCSKLLFGDVDECFQASGSSELMSHIPEAPLGPRCGLLLWVGLPSASETLSMSTAQTWPWTPPAAHQVPSSIMPSCVLILPLAFVAHSSPARYQPCPVLASHPPGLVPGTLPGPSGPYTSNLTSLSPVLAVTPPGNLHIARTFYSTLRCKCCTHSSSDIFHC